MRAAHSGVGIWPRHDGALSPLCVPLVCCSRCALHSGKRRVPHVLIGSGEGEVLGVWARRMVCKAVGCELMGEGAAERPRVCLTSWAFLEEPGEATPLAWCWLGPAVALHGREVGVDAGVDVVGPSAFGRGV
jgi:hypothetical protein